MVEKVDINKNNKDNRIVVQGRVIKKVTILGCTGAIIIATFGLFGYIPGLRILGSARPDYYPMAPSTGISFLLLGLILVLYVKDFYPRSSRLYAIIFSALVSIFGFLKCIEYLAGVETSFEEAIVTISDKLGEIPIGIMSPSTGALFFLSGITIILLIFSTTRKEQTKIFGHSAGILGSLIFICSIIFALSYLYGQPFLYGVGKTAPMAITTAIAFLFLGVALISAVGTNYVPVSFFVGSSTRSRLLRIFVPLIIFVVLIQNIINILMRDIFKMNDALLTALYIVIFAIFVVFVVFRAGYIMSNTIDKVEEKLRAEITERKQAEESLVESEAMFKGIFSQAPIGIELYESDGNLISVNQECLNIFGVRNVEEIKGFKLFEDPNVSAEAKTQLRNGELVDYQSEFDFEVVKKLKLYKTTRSGKCFLHFQITPYKISDRGNKGFVVHVQDITERKRAEEEIIKHRKHLEELVKERTTKLEDKTKTLEKSQQALVFLTEDVNETSAELENVNKKLEISNKELEAFAYSVSHDLRGPLRAISGFTRILMEDYVGKLDAEGKRLGGIIQQNTKKMGQLIDDLLAFSRMGRVSMSFSKIDMKEMANAIYHEATNAEARKRIAFTIADLPKAEGDTNMMRQVWMNLISNAIKFSAHRKPALISVSCQEEENRLIYCIKDNGAGFNMKYKDKLFGVFQRLHSEKEFEGTGVGLALVQRIIHRHGGEVWAKAEVDNGAAFYFSLPKNRRI